MKLITVRVINGAMWNSVNSYRMLYRTSATVSGSFYSGPVKTSSAQAVFPFGLRTLYTFKIGLGYV